MGFLILIFIIFLVSFYSSLNDCNNRTLPIFLPLENKCIMKYCKDEDFIINICVKGNNIIKTEWLNNIIKFGVENCRFSKIEKFSTGDMILFSSASSNRYFYGLKKRRKIFI